MKQLQEEEEEEEEEERTKKDFHSILIHFFVKLRSVQRRTDESTKAMK